MQTSVQRSALIAGAGIAGPALAYWLGRAGWRVTVVERAPVLRAGGQAVDFRGPVHRRVLERMGLWEPIHAHRTRLGAHDLIDRDGATRATLPALVMSGDVEILRGDLVRLLYDRTRATADYRFDDSIAGLAQDAAGVTVTFASGGVARHDLVVAADGLRSRTRALAFPDAVLRYHGCRVVGCTIPNVLGLVERGVTYSEPGRGVCVTSARDPGEARLLLVYRAPPGRTLALADAFAGAGWEVPRLVALAARAPDRYADDVSTVRVPRYAHGRVVLLGDAAHGGTLGGQGTSVAMIGAYLLAGELAASPDDPAAAFARYEAHLRPYATRCQQGATHVGGFFAPRTRAGIWLRNAMYRALASRPLARLFERMVTSAATDLALPAYQ